MPNTSLSGAPVPANPWAPAIAQHWLEYAEFVDQRLNLYAENEADRDARYPAVPAGTQVTGPDGRQWVKLTDGSWAQIAGPMLFLQNLNFRAGWEPGGASGIYTNGIMVSLDLRARYTGTTTITGSGTANSGYDFPSTTVAVVPNSYRPKSAQTMALVSDSTLWDGAGKVNVTEGNVTIVTSKPSGQIVPGDVITGSATWVI